MQKIEVNIVTDFANPLPAATEGPAGMDIWTLVQNLSGTLRGESGFGHTGKS